MFNTSLALKNIFSVDKDSNESLISEDIKQKTKAELDRFTDKIQNADYTTQSGALDAMVNSLMKPLIKDWLDNNLPKIVEEVVTKEIKKIVPKS